jgi:tetratricopeptide (TPR) repeat protein
MTTTPTSVRLLLPTDVWIHGAAAVGALVVFATAPLVQSPALAARLGLGFPLAAGAHAAGAGLVGLSALLHACRLCLAWLAGQSPKALLPCARDLRELLQAVAFGAGLRPTAPSWGRFSYREKIPYLVFWGALPLLAATGLAAGHPAAAVGATGAPGLAALASLHGAAGLLIVPFLAWHVFFAHLQPGVLFWNPVWLTGKASARQVERTRPGWAASLRQTDERAPEEETEAQKAASIEHVLADGNRAAREGRYGDAERLYLEALELYPGYSQALFNLAVVRLRAGSRAEAKQALVQFLERDPFNPMAEKARTMIDEIEAADGHR